MTEPDRHSRDEPRPDPALEAYREAARVDPPSEQRERELFDVLEGRIERARAGPAWRLRARSTTLRRVIALGAFGVMAVVCWLTYRRADWSVYPALRMGLALGAMGCLLGLSLVTALRPLHRPALSRAKGWAVVALSLLATLVIATLPPAHTATPEAIPSAPLYEHAPPCVFIGLLFGLPVYALARLLDRGASFAPLMAAVAAGLAGNLVLQIHCPITAPVHNVAGHFGVALLFVLAVAVAERIRGRG